MNNYNGFNLLSYSKHIKNQTEEYKNNIQSINDITTNFNWLEEQLLQNDRKISTLDFYNIVGTTNNTTIFTDFNELLKNKSLLLTSPVSFNGEHYAVGDILYKQSNGQPQRLQLGGGVYYPIVDTNRIQWKYSINIPSQEDNPKLEYNIDLVSYKNAKVYSQKFKVNELDINNRNIEFDVITDLWPVIKFYHQKDVEGKEYEEVFWDDYILKIQKKDVDKWVINKIPIYIDYVVVK